MLDFKEITPKQYPTNLLNKDWHNRSCGFIDQDGADEFFDQVNEFEVFDDDVWLITLPKCGTTWMQELIWLVLNDFDFETAKSVDLELRSPYFDLEWDFAEDKNNMFKRVEELERPRLIKSHLPLALLPPQLWMKKPKIIYVFRNPKDAWLSFYHHDKYFVDLESRNHTLDAFIDNLFKSRIPLDSPLEHAAEFYALRNEPWVYYTSFERMKTNLRSIIQDVCDFLNKTINEEQMQKMLKHLSFEEMRNNTKTNHFWEFQKSAQLRNIPYKQPSFVREGKVGGHKEAFSAAMNERVDKYLEKESIRLNHTLDELLLLNKN